MIDYSNLAVLATRFHDQLAKEIVRSSGKKKLEMDITSFNVCIEELRGTRNKCQHFTSGISTDEKDRAYSHMIQVANLLGLRELRDKIAAMRDMSGDKPQLESTTGSGRQPSGTTAVPQPGATTDDKSKDKDSVSKYDRDQLKVIDATGGRFLVLAPPGCGKTDVLSERIVRARRTVALGDMACLTFTNRASKEMLKRVKERVGVTDATSIYVGNIHKFCHAFLIDNNLMPGGTCIVGDDEITAVIEDICTYISMFMSTKNLVTFVENANNYITEKELGLPSEAMDVSDDYDEYYKMAKSADMDPSKATDGYVIDILTYRQFKASNGLVTYGDLLLWAYYYLHNDKEHKYRRYKWVEVDEVQDLSPLQMAIIDELTDSSAGYTVMYLGDEQQAIFSFVGAKLETLEKLRDRCENTDTKSGGFMRLHVNYRSPKYLLDVFNAYASKNLDASAELLPHSDTSAPYEKEDLRIVKSTYQYDQYDQVAQIVKDYADKYPRERTAVVVWSNNTANDISSRLDRLGIKYYKVSGREVTSSMAYKMVSSLVNVCVHEDDCLSWARLINLLAPGKTFHKLSMTMEYLSKIKKYYVLPLDLMNGQTYSAAFHQCYFNEEIVIIDFTATGNSILKDDIVKVEAVKVRQGTIIEGSRQCWYLDTRMEIMKTTAGKPNPFFREYNANEHLPRAQALGMLLDYIGDDAVAGYDTDVTCAMLRYNVIRSLHGRAADLRAWDIRKILRMAEPRLGAYSLEQAAHRLSADGATADKLMTLKNIADHCAWKIETVIPKQEALKGSDEAQTVTAALRKIEPLISEIRLRLYDKVENGSCFANDVEYVYSWLKAHEIVKTDDKKAPAVDAANGYYISEREIRKEKEKRILTAKIDLIIEYIRKEWVDNEPMTLHERLNKRASYLSTFKEGDLINSNGLIDSHIFIMTIHKAKGLEFENVIIPDVLYGVFPMRKDTPEEEAEAARKLYVAMTRAKKRLCLTYYEWHGDDPQTLSPFIEKIKDMFYMQAPDTL